MQYSICESVLLALTPLVNNNIVGVGSHLLRAAQVARGLSVHLLLRWLTWLLRVSDWVEVWLHVLVTQIMVRLVIHKQRLRILILLNRANSLVQYFFVSDASRLRQSSLRPQIGLALILHQAVGCSISGQIAVTLNRNVRIWLMVSSALVVGYN